MANRICVEYDCNRKHYGRGWCRYHYQVHYLAGRLTDRPRTLVEPGADLDTRLRNIGWTVTARGCWEWKGSLNAAGYGQVAVGTNRPEMASRTAYRAWIGPIPQGMDVCHHCDNPPCINPACLFLGTRATNAADMVQKRRSLNGERSPQHRLTDDEVAEIRALKAGGLTNAVIAERYGITEGYVSMLARYMRRQHLTYPVPAA